MSTVQESNLSRATKIPEPKLPIGVDPRVASFIRPIVDILRVREGFAPNHDVLDKAITVRDLYKSGLIDILKDGRRHTYSGADDGPLVPSASVSNPDGAVDYTAPPVPTGLTASGAFANVFLTFDEPSSLYGNHSFTEVWRSGTNDIGSATYIGSTTTRFYADEIGAGGSFYYWVRFVSKAGKTGPFNAISGTLGETSYDHSYVLDTLTVAWKAITAYTAGPPPDYVIPSPGNRTGLWYKVVTAGTSGTTEPTWPTVIGNQVTDGTVVWEAIAAGSETIPFTVGEVAGSPAVVMSAKTFIADASIESAKIKDLVADKITAGTITAAIEMTAATMTGGLLRTSSGTGQRVEISGSDAWPLWFGSGTKGDANGKFMLKSDGSLYVKDHTGATILQVLPTATTYGTGIDNTQQQWADVSGAGKPSDNADQTQPTLEAGVTITSGGVTLSAGGAFRGGQTDFNTGVGVFLGYSGTAYKFSVGDPNGGHLTWDGSALTTRSAATGSKRIEINPAGDNEIHFWGDRGDGTIEELATIGINLSGSDYYVGLFGSTSAGNSRVGIAGLSNSRAGVYGYSAGYYGVYASTGASTLPALYATGTYCAKLAMNSPNSGGHLVMAPNNVPPTHTAEAGTFYMDSTAKLWINEGGSTWRLVGTQPYSASTGTTGNLGNGGYTDFTISNVPANPIIAFTAKCNSGIAENWVAKIRFDDGRIIEFTGNNTIYTTLPALPSTGSISVRLQANAGTTTTVTWRLDIIAHW